MKLQTKAMLLLFGSSFLYVLCAGGTLFWYMHAHPGGLIPRWISVPMFCLLILTLVLPSFIIRRAARKQAAVETAEEGRIRRARAAIGIKVGLVLWGLIFLNGIRMVVEHEVRWLYAVPGLAVDILLIVVFWNSLRRLKKFEEAGSQQGNT